MPIYGHPKDPYKRIEILPSTRTITAKVDGETIAESSNNQFLHETSLRTRFYMPKTAVSVSLKTFIISPNIDAIAGTLGVPYREQNHIIVPLQGRSEL